MLLMTFTLNKAKFGLLLEEVEYIVDNVSNIEASMTGKYIRGTAILRDEVVPIYNLRSRFEFCGKTQGEMVIVVSHEGQKLGLEVGHIDKMVYIENVTPIEIPLILQKERLCIKCAVSYEDEIILVIDVKKIVTEIL